MMISSFNRTKIPEFLIIIQVEEINYFHQGKVTHSLRADEMKLWLIPSVKQCRNPCSGLPAVYPDLSMRHDWPVKKGLCFVCSDHQSG